MNRENIKTVLDALIELEASGRQRRFNMDRWFTFPEGVDEYTALDARFLYSVADVQQEIHPRFAEPDPKQCGTAACLAGWGQLVLAKSQDEREMPANEFTQFAFTLEDEAASYWFCGTWADKPLRSITLAETILFLQERLEEDSALPADYDDGQY